MPTYTRLTARSLSTSTPSQSEMTSFVSAKIRRAAETSFRESPSETRRRRIELETRDDAVEAEAQRIVGADLLPVITAGDRREGDGPARIVVGPVLQ